MFLLFGGFIENGFGNSGYNYYYNVCLKSIVNWVYESGIKLLKYKEFKNFFKDFVDYRMS